MKKVYALLLFAMLLSASCSQGIAKRVGEKPEVISRYPIYGLSRIIDREGGVVCYMFTSGIDCLPIEDTYLQE